MTIQPPFRCLVGFTKAPILFNDKWSKRRKLYCAIFRVLAYRCQSRTCETPDLQLNYLELLAQTLLNVSPLVY